MLLGLVYHVTLIYSFFGWNVTDGSSWDGFGVLSYLLHSFRMPAFFIIAGYFSALSLERSGGRSFLRKRLLRVGVPMVASLLTINVVLWYITAGFRAGVWNALWSPQFAEAWRSGSIFAHLWFLQVLLVLNLLHLLARSLHMRLPRAAEKLPAWVLGVMVPALVVGAYALFDKSSLPAWAVNPAYCSPGMRTVAIFAPFFFLGIYLYRFPRHACSRFSFPRLLALGALGILCAWLPGRVPMSGYLGRILELYSESMLSWIAAKALLGWAARSWNKPSRLFHSLATASYTVYLLHVVVILAISSALLDVAWSAGVKFVVVLTGTAVLSFAAHYLAVQRSALLSFLLNGILPRRRPAAVPVPIKTFPEKPARAPRPSYSTMNGAA
jgi:glucan biosynthesis protein C